MVIWKVWQFSGNSKFWFVVMKEKFIFSPTCLKSSCRLSLFINVWFGSCPVSHWTSVKFKFWSVLTADGDIPHLEIAFAFFFFNQILKSIKTGHTHCLMISRDMVRFTHMNLNLFDNIHKAVTKTENASQAEVWCLEIKLALQLQLNWLITSEFWRFILNSAKKLL